MKKSVCAVICAGGKGFRAGFEKNKLLVPLSGERVLKKTLSAFDFSLIDEIIVASSKEDLEEISALCSAYPKAKVILGGNTRSESVNNALQAVQSDIVLILDGARPFVTREIIEGCGESVKSYGSGICAVPCTDTIAIVEKDELESIPKRERMYALQTPQGFFTENIRYAYRQAFDKGE